MPQAYACGAGRMNMKEYQLGRAALRLQGKSEDTLPVDIDLILEYNKKKIIF